MFIIKRRWVFACFILSITLLFFLVRPVQAHGYIVRAIPEDRAVLERAPTRLQYWFSEGLEPEFSSINVRDQNGNIIASGGVPESDNALLTVELPGDLPNGAYIVELRPAFASDGHVIAESRVFFIGEEIGGIAGLAATDRAIPLEIVWRTMAYIGIMLLFGAFTLYAGVLVPAWGSANHPAGLLPPRVMQRLNWIAGFAFAMSIAGNLLALIQQTMTFFNIGFVQALSPNFWSLVRVGSRFGDIWNARMLLLVIAAGMFALSLYLRRSQPETVRAFWTANAWVIALVLGSFSVLSHAAGSLMLPWVGITMDWLHLLGVGFWAGGLAVLVLVLPTALHPYEGETRRLALLAALRRFSRIAAAAVFVVITTGIYSASNWISTPSDLTQTTFGGALISKVVLAGLLIGVGALHYIALQPERYARFNQAIQRMGGFRRTLRLEAVLVIVVLAAAALLNATPLPVPEFTREQARPPTEVIISGDLTIVLTILPGGPGVNTYDTTITREGRRVEGLNIRLQKVHPAGDWRSPWHTAEAVDRGLYVTAGDDIYRVGRWWTLMDIIDENGTQTRLAFDWEISQEAAVIESIPPNMFNIAALLAVSVALLRVVYPFARHLYDRLDLNPLVVTAAGGAAAATMIALTAGFIAIQETRSRYEETLNPPPQVVNAVLPTQASLDRGRALYEEYCIGWQAVPRDFNALRSRLSRIRDEELYSAVVEGWRDLPPCAFPLAFYQRWDLVNYLRTWESS